MRLDWENEIEVVKQGTAVTLYILPNMFVTMALIPLSVVLGMMLNMNLVLLSLLAIYSILAVLSYMAAVKERR